MNITNLVRDPERSLATAHAPTRLRPALAALWALDERLGSVVARAGEGRIAEIRLAWWREALDTLDRTPHSAEPLLQLIATELLPLGVTGHAMAEIEAGWAALLHGPTDDGALRLHAEARGRTLFRLAATVLGDAGNRAVGIAGEGWALADLAARTRDLREAAAARGLAAERLGSISGFRWPTRLRPIGMLAVLARQDARSPPGQGRRQGSPRRIARMLWMRLTGR